MARFSLLLFVVVLTAGCGSSQRITASDPSEREKLNTSIQNEEVVLHLEDDTEVRAQNVCIEPDSVSFIEPEKKTSRVIATRRLRTIVVDPGIRSKAGIAVGAGAFLGGIGLLSSVDFREHPRSAGARLVGGAISTIFGFLIMTAAALPHGKQYRIENSRPAEGQDEEAAQSTTQRITHHCS